MAPRGRKPKPTHLKLVTGTFRKDRAPKNEPKPLLTVPECPKELSDDAKLEWERVSVELHKLGLLSNLDRAALAAYCSAYGLWVRAERELRTLVELAGPLAGLVQKSRTHGFVGNPLNNISRRAAAAMIRYAAEFGMTPSARARVNGAGSKETDQLAEFLS
jgi:P27 family predicted phage terminase small subunit